MTQGIDCEPSLSLAISADKSLDDLTFAVLPFFDQVAAVARKGKNVVTLDGVVIPDSMFTPAGGGFEVARVPLPDCAPSLQVCTHRLHGLHGMTMRGMDIACQLRVDRARLGDLSSIRSMIPAPAERAL